jgi:hypothetical protein
MIAEYEMLEQDIQKDITEFTNEFVHSPFFLALAGCGQKDPDPKAVLKILQQNHDQAQFEPSQLEESRRVIQEKSEKLSLKKEKYRSLLQQINSVQITLERFAPSFVI